MVEERPRGAGSVGGVGAAPRSARAFVGRGSELDAVVDALEASPALILIEGEAGIGKTRLLLECLARVENPGSGPRILSTTCPPLPEPFPLGPLVDTLRRSPEWLHGLEPSPLAGALRPLFPEWADRLPPALEPLDDPNATRHRTLRAMVELIARARVDVLVVDDVQWADQATVELLLTLIAARGRLDGGRPVGLVLTYRPAEIPPGSPLFRLISHPPVEVTRVRVHLDPLDMTSTTELVSSMFEVEQISREFVEFLHHRTAGIPLALEESIALLRDRGDIFREDGDWHRADVSELQVPPTVRDSVLERVARLAPDARRVMEAAAVLTEPADEDLLAVVAGLDPDLARSGLADVLSAGLVREEGPRRYVCRHDLMARATEEAIPVSERRRLHLRAGRALERLDPQPLARLSRHFREADEIEPWIRYATAAADLALASGEDRAAVVELLRLLTDLEHPPERSARLARRLGEAAASGVTGLGELGSLVTTALADVLTGEGLPTEERGEIRLLLGRLWLQLGEFDTAAEQIQVAAYDLKSRPELAARAMFSLALPRGPGWPVERHVRWLARATDLLPAVTSPSERISLAVDRTTALLMLGDESGWEAAEFDPDLPTPYERRQVARGLMNVGHFAIAWGRDTFARERLVAADELMRATGYRRLMNSVGLTTAYLDWRSGRWDDLAERVRGLAEASDTLPEARLEARLVLALLALAHGDRRTAETGFRDVLADAVRRGLVDAQAAPAAALGRLHLAADRPEEALGITSPTVDLLARKGVWLWATDLLPVHLDALAASGRDGEAVDLVRLFAAGIDGLDAPAPAAALQTCQGILAANRGSHDEAASRFEQAAREWKALPRPYDENLALEREAHARVAGSAREHGVELLLAAERGLRTLGARWDADRAALALRRLGVEVPRPWRGGRRGYGDRLSPRELEVARLVARGMTNRQVAEALFLSARTVGHHLGAAMRKLGVPSRTALAAALADRDGDAD